MSERLYYLFERYINKTSTASEETELMGLALEDENQEQLKELIHAVWADDEQEGKMTDEKADKFLERIFPKPALKVRKINWRRIAVAASILLVVGLGSYFLVNSEKTKVNGKEKVVVSTDIEIIAPLTNRAIVTLADGSQVFLDSVGNGELAKQGNIRLVKLANGQITYETATGEIINELKYNTLSNPKGSKVIDMTLADGSRVWLNAGSSVTYPIAFVGNERRLSITGEAYFEVNKQLAVGSRQFRPFIVKKGSVQVQVLGTHFNVNAYDDEEVIKVTLLEGSVKVSNSQSSLIIKPNQQALVRGNAAIGLNNYVDVDAVMAWKNGFFSFKNSDLQTVMKEIARWYDVEVVYEGKVPDMRFGGDIARSSSAAQVMTILAKSKVNFRIEGKRIIVMN